MIIVLLKENLKILPCEYFLSTSNTRSNIFLVQCYRNDRCKAMTCILAQKLNGALKFCLEAMFLYLVLNVFSS